MGSEDVKVTAMNMYKYKERLRLYKRWPCSTYILNRKSNAHMVHMGLKSSTSHYTLFSQLIIIIYYLYCAFSIQYPKAHHNSV